MRFTSFATAVVAMLVSTPATTACSSDISCSDYNPPAGFDGTAPTVSLKNDVFPIFSQSCAFTSCHGATDGNPNGIFLGGADASKVRAGIVNVRSGELSTMSFITPNDAHNSYLMRKMDSSQCLLNAQCTDGSCGDSMPKNSDPLDPGVRDVVRKWIIQGAPDN